MRMLWKMQKKGTVLYKCAYYLDMWASCANFAADNENRVYCGHINKSRI